MTTHTDTLTDLATERGITIEVLVSDLLRADDSYRKVLGRTVVSREKGIAALSDKVNDMLRYRTADDIRAELLSLAEIDTVPSTLAETIALLGRRKKTIIVLNGLHYTVPA